MAKTAFLVSVCDKILNLFLLFLVEFLLLSLFMNAGRKIILYVTPGTGLMMAHFLSGFFRSLILVGMSPVSYIMFRHSARLCDISLATHKRISSEKLSKVQSLCFISILLSFYFFVLNVYAATTAAVVFVAVEFADELT